MRRKEVGEASNRSIADLASSVLICNSARVSARNRSFFLGNTRALIFIRRSFPTAFGLGSSTGDFRRGWGAVQDLSGPSNSRCVFFCWR